MTRDLLDAIWREYLWTGAGLSQIARRLGGNLTALRVARVVKRRVGYTPFMSKAGPAMRKSYWRAPRI